MLILTMHSKKRLRGGYATLKRNIIVIWAKYIYDSYGSSSHHRIGFSNA